MMGLKSLEHIGEYIEKLDGALAHLNRVDVQIFCGMVCSAIKHDSHIFICGNGGSAALSSHMAIDMVKAYPEIKVISLTDNVPAITAWSNDLSYNLVFAQQLKNLICPNDLVIGISGSGASENVVRAIEFAIESKCKTVVLTGNAGERGSRPLHSLASHSVIVDSPIYGVVEDIHCVINHILFHYLEDFILKGASILKRVRT